MKIGAWQSLSLFVTKKLTCKKHKTFRVWTWFFIGKCQIMKNLYTLWFGWFDSGWGLIQQLLQIRISKKWPSNKLQLRRTESDKILTTFLWRFKFLHTLKDFFLQVDTKKYFLFASSMIKETILQNIWALIFKMFSVVWPLNISHFFSCFL